MNLRKRKVISLLCDQNSQKQISKKIFSKFKTHEANENSGQSNNSIAQALRQVASLTYAAVSMRYFKLGSDSYSGQDQFIGIRIPEIRKIAEEYGSNLKDTKSVVLDLLQSEIHEFRLAAVMILVAVYEKEKFRGGWDLQNDYQKDKLYRNSQCHESVLNFYIQNRKYLNNWDIIDISTYKIVGSYLQTYENENINKLMIFVKNEHNIPMMTLKMYLSSWYCELLESNQFWDARIAIVGLLGMAKQDRSKTDFIYLIIAYFLSIYKERQWYINERKFNDTDLIEKAMGWILRECGNKNMQDLINFLKIHHSKMGRVCLSYCCEKMSKKPAFLNSKKNDENLQ